MNSHHPTEQDLELYVNYPDTLTGDARRNLRAHLRQCSVCREQYRQLREFRSELQSRMKRAPTPEEETLAETLLTRKAKGFLPLRGVVKKPREEIFSPYTEVADSLPITLARRIVHFVRRYPVRTVSYASSIAAAIIMLAVLFQRPFDRNPSYAKVEHSMLTVYNRYDRELWSKDAIGMPEASTRNPFVDSKQLLSVADIDGDGANELLVSGNFSLANNMKESFSADSLYCFRSDGRIQWVRAYPENIFAQKFSFTRGVGWIPRIFFTTQSPDNAHTRLFATLNCDPYFPSKLIEIEPSTGTVLHTYWHSGAIGFALPIDIDQTGKEQIVIVGINNGFNRAFAAVLDPDNLSGCGPAPDDFYPVGMAKAHEREYMLFPSTELARRMNRIAYTPPNNVRKVSGQSIIVYVNDLYSAGGGTLLYTLGRHLRLESVTWSDPFLKFYNESLEKGIVKDSLSPAYWEKLKNSAQYWDGEKFVNHWTINSSYRDSKEVPLP